MTRAALDPVRQVVPLLSLAAFVSSAAMRLGDPLIPQVSAEFSASTGTVAWMVTAFAVAYGVFQLVYGPLGDRHGKLRVIGLALLASALTALAAAFAGSLAVLVAARFIGGVTTAAVIPLSLAYIGDSAPYAERHAVLARYMSGQILGLLGGQVAGGVIGDLMGWRMVFVLLAGAYLLIAALLLWRTWTVPPLRAQGAGGGALRLLARPRVRLVSGAVTVEGLLFYGAFTFCGAMLHDRLGLDFTAVGMVLGCFALGALVYVVFVQRFIGRLGERGMVRVGALLIGGAFVALALLDSVLLAVPALFLAGLGFYLVHTTLQLNGTQMAPEARGSGIAIFACGLFAGQAVGAALGGLIVDRLGDPPLFLACGLAFLVFGEVVARQVVGR
ncbi:MAG: MFS transporter [Thalassobaculales bacterium]